MIHKRIRYKKNWIPKHIPTANQKHPQEIWIDRGNKNKKKKTDGKFTVSKQFDRFYLFVFTDTISGHIYPIIHVYCLNYVSTLYVIKKTLFLKNNKKYRTTFKGRFTTFNSKLDYDMSFLWLWFVLWQSVLQTHFLSLSP